jgi:hypothetical protein
MEQRSCLDDLSVGTVERCSPVATDNPKYLLRQWPVKLIPNHILQSRPAEAAATALKNGRDKHNRRQTAVRRPVALHQQQDKFTRAEVDA